MPYMIISAIIITALIIYIFNNRLNKNQSNYFQDIMDINYKRDDLKKSGERLSGNQSGIQKRNSKRKLIKSLGRSYKMILKSYEYIDRDVRNKKEVVPAAEWLLDNIYLIEKEYKDIKNNMPESYYRNLPVINDGAMKGYPRIYNIAIEIVAHTDGRVDEKSIETFINSYQKNTFLTSGELWALPIMLRIALIQDICEVIEKIIFAEKEKNRADGVFDKIIGAINEKKLAYELNRLDSRGIIFTSHFTERLLKELRDNGIDNPEIYKWMDKKLGAQDSSSERMINIEHSREANFQIFIGNCINGLREVEALNWKDSFEKLSCLEKTLREDPLKIYENMDFESRDYYRHKVEKLARRMNTSECFMASYVVECAKNAIQNDEERYKGHVGYYIIDEGVECLENKFDYKYKFIDRAKRNIKKHRFGYYSTAVILCTLLLMALVITFSIAEDKKPQFLRYIIASIAILIPCSEIIISIINWSINHLLKPRIVPKLDFKDGIPEDCSTVVVIPTILDSEKRVHELISDMEVYYIANNMSNIYFALLGDFKDGDREHEDDDSSIIRAVLNDIRELNRKYNRNGEDVFYFFNRYRQFNQSENKWMGWERKRGKLMEFNSLIRGDKNTSYNVISGIKSLLKVKYVITLDADTQLPRDSARKLIGAMAHILNKPCIENKRVVRGYGIMQPKISVSIVSANKTLFSKIFSGETGIDIYTTAISNVYQDLFGEGIFTGKGIYDVDVFNYMLKDKIPENSVLSHDLLEGSFVRTALVSDVELIDGYPSTYNASIKRLHRWVRGDWQLIPWILKKDPGINRLSKWKMIDNLRRSLLSVSIIILLILSISVLPDGSDKWLIITVLALICPVLFDVSETVISPVRGINLTGRIKNCKMAIEQVFLNFCFLPYHAYIMLDAILKTIYRVFISKKRLLEWQTFADVESMSGKKLKDFLSTMFSGSIISVMILFLSFRRSTDTGLLMLVSCILWFVSPYIAYYISTSKTSEADSRLNDEEIKLIRKLSRRTWAYFEDFVSPDSNWLAPDNYQESPANGLAHRTSPTNMAMGLISNIAAFDLGYIGIVECVERIDKIFKSMCELERFKGHFYNWYDTKSKKPLHPRYISTVDSGNLVCYLWVISEALEEYKKRPFIEKNKVDGLCDLLYIGNDEIEDINHIKNFYTDTINEIKKRELDIISWKTILLNLWSKSVDLEKSKNYDRLYWNNKVKHTVSKYLRELQKLFPALDIIVERTDNISKLAKKLKYLSSNVKLQDLSQEIDRILNDNYENCNDKYENDCWASDFTKLLEDSKDEINKFICKIDDIKSKLNTMICETDFKILYDKKRQLFSIAYDVEKNSIQNCYYDLLASEARQASFAAIAKGDVGQEHWFKLGRSIASMGKNKALASWSGTMFEYFMPLIIMKNYPDTIFDETYNAVIEQQKKYCKQKKVPWGISESGFYSFDINMNYQYKAFGVPETGLKRGLESELVISPYSTLLAMQVAVRDGFDNIKKLMAENLNGRYGFYEAIDYTKVRIKSKKKAIVKCFMIHHEGMSLLSLDNILNGYILQQRFHRVPKVRATELLLQEKVPKSIMYDRNHELAPAGLNDEKQHIIVRSYSTAKTQSPEAHLLSNGTYSLMITNSGSGYSKKDDMMVYRWKEDSTVESGGMFFYIKDVTSHKYWSAAYEPCKKENKDYKVLFSLDKVEFETKNDEISTVTDIAVSNEDNAEIRCISITNHSKRTRIVEVTSYFEITLTTYDTDIVHPAFSNLFINTEFVENPMCIAAYRRPRSKGESKHWIMQTIALDGEGVGTLQYETSRANFIGRCKDLSNPQAVEDDTPLKNTVGAVLDPIISMRKRIRIKPGQTCKIAYSTAVGNSKDEVLNLASKYRDIRNVKRIFELAWTQTQVEMKYLGIKSPQANLYQIMASKILFLNSAIKFREKYIKNIKGGQSCLWPYGISGDLPIVLLLVRKEEHIDMVRQMLNAHEYWSIKGLKVDLVILNFEDIDYVQSLQNSINDLISSSHDRDKQNKKGGVFLLNSINVPNGTQNLLMACARLVIDSDEGLIITQIKNNFTSQSIMEKLEKSSIEEFDQRQVYKFPERELEYFNGLGGFDVKSNAYVIKLKDMENTPAPWINVISNGKFGFHVSEIGSSYTWSKNSRENKITYWSNDWVTDPFGEAMYVRDEVSGKAWSITPGPLRDNGEYVIEHGFGYSNFKHSVHGIYGEVSMFVPLEDDVKLCIVDLKNLSKTKRKLSLTYYAQTVLGVVPQKTNQYISTYLSDDNKYIYARNPYSEYFGNLYSYLFILGGYDESFTGNRKTFIGRGSSIKNPEFLNYVSLPDDVGAGFDSCIAENVKVDINENEEVKLIVMLGESDDIQNIKENIDKYKDPMYAYDKLLEVKKYWKSKLETIQVKTPNNSMDIMLNGWLLYQVISCRLWSRTAFYQSGGAYGFRDQLQDVLSLSYAAPEIIRKHILYNSSRQFIEGDVQHWWHPYVDSGIRTRFSDDLLWLPYDVINYIETTGDYSILDETSGYLEEPPLKEGEDERYNIAGKSDRSGSIYEHCIKAIDHSLRFGSHNLPLMGSGDWNDGMNTIGNKGNGESVWLGWFLYSILNGFADICKYKNDESKALEYIQKRDFIKENLEKNAWDGNWYRRAYFDDGSPLGSMENDECQIDSISQSWSLISKAADMKRAKTAMESVERYLVKEDKNIVLLLTPAFDRSLLEPGYIKGYVPGVRENGGQYTHAAVWVIFAYTLLKDGNRACRIFDMINPINHTKSLFECGIYKVEPYVMAADVYNCEPHIGRGGWTWYTGAAGWMYRAGIEGILGFKVKYGKGFSINPCIPDDWPGFEMTYRKEKSIYNIKVRRGDKKGIDVDGNSLEGDIVPFSDGVHEIQVVI